MGSEVIIPMAPRRVGMAGALWSKNQLAIEFGVSERTVSKRLDGVPPDGEVKGHPAWHVSTAAQAILQVGRDSGDFSLDDLSPKERKDWVQSEHELLRMRAYTRELVPVGEVRETLATLVKAVVSVFATFADLLEREVGLSPEQVQGAQRLADRMRLSLMSMLQPYADEE